MREYKIVRVRCGCHPDTCSCNPYAIHLYGDPKTYSNPKRICSGWNEDDLMRLVKRANKGLKKKGKKK